MNAIHALIRSHIYTVHMNPYLIVFYGSKHSYLYFVIKYSVPHQICLTRFWQSIKWLDTEMNALLCRQIINNVHYSQLLITIDSYVFVKLFLLTAVNLYPVI